MKLLYKQLVLFVAACLSFNVSAKDKTKYAVADIPKELLANAHAVVRESTTIYEYISPSNAVETNFYAITILKESALDKSEFTEFYNSLMKINYIEATVYDKDGKKVKRIKSDDINDYSAISGFSLYEDSRVKHFDPEYDSYPFTIEYSFRRKYETTLYAPNWSVFDGYNTSIELTQFKYIAPLDYNFKYKASNVSVDPVIEEVDEKKVYTWEVTNYKAPKYERNDPPYYKWAPIVFTSPTHFKVEGHTGSYNTWQEFGQFSEQLLEGKDNISQTTLNEVKALITEEMSDYEKIKTIHGYAQKKNRYVSIQDGLGGFEPFDAETVERLSYGDCKALTNFTMTLLKNNGYDCYYTLVSAGRTTPIDPEFSNNRFNHAFLCVPLKADTLWIECTNPHSPCGYIGDFTDDRYVLLVDGEKSRLVRTPAYKASDNAQILKGNIVIDADGNAKGSYTFSYIGAQYSDEFGLTLRDEKDRKKSIINSIDIPNFTLDSYNIEVEKSRHPRLDKTLNLTLPKYGAKMGSRILVQLNSINDQTYIPPFARKRTLPLYFKRSYSECDTINITIPDNYKVEALPEPIEFENEFAIYKSSARVDGKEIIYNRQIEFYKGEYPKEEYNEFRSFLEKVAKADAAKAILIPDEG